MKIKLRNIGLMIIFLLVLASCGGNKENVKGNETNNKVETQESTENTSEAKLVIEDVLGRKVELDKPMEKVIIQGSGSGGPFMTMMYLDKENFYKKIAAMDDGIKLHRNDLYQRLVDKIPELDRGQIGRAHV